ncbi:MAG TPA: NAD-dependent succinate-semialdehyde dehydrogenase [Candidatus Hydrogenedentes bacterium]|nr:NAD-dependent succinate-semialdehyde dehydrogenase [Candidatus Hydrogenedentota bacterium]HPG65874.1 NAD-dependent succinate-semialdehyde dehydrogenase [Candidatus Hydrogenedentota bacterium]
MPIPNQMYIDGQWLNASDGGTIEVVNPATEEVVDAVPKATAEDLDRALDAADRAWKSWREVDAWTRSAAVRRVAEWIRDHVDAMADVLTEEQGKTLGESAGEIRAGADQFDWYADEARRLYGRVIDAHARDHRLLVIRQPIGPVAAFAPWNFPVLLTARKMAPAIATGCSVIVKPGVEVPRSALFLAQACHEAGIPAGVVNMVTGNSSAISEHLLASDVIRKVSLTGSVPVGQRILHLCADRIKAVSMELGGHSPVLVFEDTDVDKAAETCARGKFRNNGQVCIAASRFFVQESVAERFIDRFVTVARSMKLGNGKDPKTDVGPLGNRRRLEATEHLVQDAVSKGATVRCGGKRPEGFRKGFFFEPTVLTEVNASMAIMTEEPFCPVAPIATFTDLDDGLTKANATEFGLAGYVFTDNMRTAFLASEGIEAGMIGVNTLLLATAEIPFGGVKHSGFGREGGSEGIESYTITKHVNIQL